MIKENTKAPNFTALSTNKGKYSLKDSLGKYVVIYFYPKDDTPGCTIQACTFRDKYEDFKALGAEVIGISQDSTSEHKEFKEELGLPFPLLSDPDRAVADLFGVPMYLGQFPAKSSFVIGPDREVHYVYDWLFRPRNHVAKILAAMSDVTERGDFK